MLKRGWVTNPCNYTSIIGLYNLRWELADATRRLNHIAILKQSIREIISKMKMKIF